MKQILFFMEREASVNNMGDLFPTTQQVSMDLDGDPNVFFMSWLPFGTPESIASHMLTMQDYTAIEIMEVVSLSYILFMVL